MSKNKVKVISLYYLIGLGFLLEISAIFGYILISKITTSGLIKYSFLLVYGILILTVFWVASINLSWKKIIKFILILDFGYILSYHLISFIFFPGLLHEINLVSNEHLVSFIPIFIFLFFAYIVIVVTFKGITKKFSKRKAQ